MTHLSKLMLACALGASLSACLVNGKPMFSLPGSSSSASSSRPSVAMAPSPDDDEPKSVATAPPVAAPESVSVPAAKASQGYAWCAAASPGDTVNELAIPTDDFAKSMDNIVSLLCDTHPGRYNAASRDKAETKRKQWMKQLGMSEADFAYEITDWTHQDPNNETKAQRGGGGGDSAREDSYKSALASSLNIGSCVASEDPEELAVCADDVGKFDLAKAFAELSADRKIQGRDHVAIRFRLNELKGTVPAYTAKVKALIAKDAGYKKMFDVAKAARADWTAHLDERKDLIALIALDKETANSTSRAKHAEHDKAFEGCGEKSHARFAKALTKYHAKDVVELGYAFPELDSEKLEIDPDVSLASWYVAHCDEITVSTIKDWAKAASAVPLVEMHKTMRKAIEGAHIQLDDMSQEDHSDIAEFKRDGATGHKKAREARLIDQIAGLQAKGESLVVTFVKQPKYTTMQCVSEKEEQRGWKLNGQPDYVIVCTSEKKVWIDPTPEPKTISKRFAVGLKVGAFIHFDALDKEGGAPTVWESKTSPAPIAELGVLLKQ